MMFIDKVDDYYCTIDESGWLLRVAWQMIKFNINSIHVAFLEDSNCARQNDHFLMIYRAIDILQRVNIRWNYPVDL